MLRNLAKYDEHDRNAHMHIVHYQKQAIANMGRVYGQTIAIVLCIGTIYGIYHFSHIYRNAYIPLPRRMCLTVYPSHVQVKTALPTFYGAYSLATAENAVAREAVRRMVALRDVVKDAGRLKQRIQFHAWEVGDFESQLVDDRVKADVFCGDGFYDRYFVESARLSKSMSMSNANATLRSMASAEEDEGDAYRRDVMVWCLLSSAYHDTYVSYDVTALGVLTRGAVGVIGQYVGEDRMSLSLVYLPKEVSSSVEARTATTGSNVTNVTHADVTHTQGGVRAGSGSGTTDGMAGGSTTDSGVSASASGAGRHGVAVTSSSVPSKVLRYLLDSAMVVVEDGTEDRAGSDNASKYEYSRRGVEELLYRAVAAEREKWVVWDVVYDGVRRGEYDMLYRRMATTCDVKGRKHDERRDGDVEAEEGVSIDSGDAVVVVSGDDDACCSYYDRSLPSLIRHHDR
jgi:hypothetical protein